MGRRVLITSIPCWNQKTGSNTLSSLFEGFDSDDLANIYIGYDLPDSNVCSRYFSIREWDVVRSVYNRKLKTGEEVRLQELNKGTTNVLDKSKQYARKRRRIFLWMRELAWKIGKWESNELNAFLDDFNPEVLVFPIESYPYFNRLNEYIIQKCKPKKVIGYLWDDNFTYKQHPHSFLHKIERYFLRKQVRRLVGMCTNVLAISPKMKAECDAEFGIESIVLTKPVNQLNEFVEYTVQKPINVLYTGKLNIGRDQSLIHLVDILEKSEYTPSDLQINVYTNSNIASDLKSRLEISGFCHIHPPIPQSKVFELQKQADVLLFLESLTSNDLTARLSFSTKLTDYFAAGKCIWAVGNEDLGPISYLKYQSAGVVCCNDDEITNAIDLYMCSPNIIQKFASIAYECGVKNHNYNDILVKLTHIIES